MVAHEEGVHEAYHQVDPSAEVLQVYLNLVDLEAYHEVEHREADQNEAVLPVVLLVVVHVQELHPQVGREGVLYQLLRVGHEGVGHEEAHPLGDHPEERLVAVVLVVAVLVVVVLVVGLHSYSKIYEI